MNLITRAACQIRRFSAETHSTYRHSSAPWDPQNRIRVISATLGVTGGIAMFFDQFYRRSTKQEIDQAMEKIEAKFDHRMNSLEARIENLTTALLNSSQRERIAAEAEVRELRKELDQLKK